jgi:tRNA(His) 5'-end guanylyltransferase
MSCYFTNKQKWRRVRSMKNHGSMHDLFFQERGENNKNDSSIYRGVVSEPSISTNNIIVAEIDRGWSTTGNLQSWVKDKKKIRFHGTVKAILIPCRDEYAKLGLKNLLWWSDTDYMSFRLSDDDCDESDILNLNETKISG